MDMENPNLRHIVAESHIPFLKGVFESAGIAVSYLAPDEFTPESVRDADALIIRTRTRCDASLLESSRCRMVATATIGTDHIDLHWCSTRGIKVANAPGCNAPAVAQYVAGCIASWFSPSDFKSLKLGIIGVGHVGTIVDRWARSLGLTTMLCDPPRAAVESGHFHNLTDIASQADIITFHTPLTSYPEPWPTRHMFDSELASQLRGNQYLINSARGPVTDTLALISSLNRGMLLGTAIDCWENEPRINSMLLTSADIATPHIAGYSLQGKIRATQMAIDSICHHFKIGPLHNTAPIELNPVPAGITPDDAIEASARLYSDTEALRSEPTEFERLRNTYDLRIEPQQLSIPRH